MSHVLTESPTYTISITVPDDGDLEVAASVNGAFQGLANRLNYLISGPFLWSVGSGGLTVTGVTTLSGGLNLSTGLAVTGAVVINSGGSFTTQSGAASFLNGTVTVNSTLSVGATGTVSVLSGGTFTSASGSTFTLNGAATANSSFTFAGSLGSSNGVVATWNGPHTFNSATTFNSGVSLLGGNNLSVSGTSTLTGNATCGGTLGVTGITTHIGDVNCGAGLNSNGTFSCTGGASFTGAVSLAGNVTLTAGSGANIAWRVLYPGSWVDSNPQANQYDEVAYVAIASISGNINCNLSHVNARAGNRIRVTATLSGTAGATIIVRDGLGGSGTIVGEVVTSATAYNAATAEFTYGNYGTATGWYRSI